MGKAVCTGLIESDAKTAIERAAELGLGGRSSIAGILEKVGFDLKDQIEELERRGLDTNGYELKVVVQAKEMSVAA